MAWLWLVSVGVTDVQFPVWKMDEYGQWVEYRFRRERGGARRVHEGLLALLERDRIEFPDRLPRDLEREESGRIEFQFEQEGEDFIASIAAREGADEGYRIAAEGNELSSLGANGLPLYCPKVADVLAAARATFGDEPVTVVALATRRLATLRDGPGEPIASGPLVARFPPERLGLEWRPGGTVPETLGAGISTWVDILVDDELAEDEAAQRRVVQRLTALVRGWAPAGARRVTVTTAGGIPALKPLMQRIPATCLGQGAVRVLEIPERQRAEASVVALDYLAQVPEQEILRFHCAEALRQRDYAGAYGLAGRFPHPTHWSLAVRDTLGPLLELPGGPLLVNGRRLEAHALAACRVEAALCPGDVLKALVRLGQFLEAATWALIARDPRIRDWGLVVQSDKEVLEGPLDSKRKLLEQGLLRTDPKDPSRYSVDGLTWKWPDWLAEGGEGGGAASVLAKLQFDYASRQAGKPSPRDYRNLLVHGGDAVVKPGDVERALRNAGLIGATGQDFGANCLGLERFGRLLSGLDAAHVTASLRKQLDGLLDTVIEGEP